MPNNYDGVVREFWREKFRALPDGARILDIATGNGAIASLAAELGEDKGSHFAIFGSDLAAINEQIVGDESAARLRDRIEFPSNTPCEKQPFENDSFDLVASQFGFEYSDTGATLIEVRRVLANGGRFIAICHHADSELIKAASRELEVYQFALGELDLFGRARDLLGALGDLTRSTKHVATSMKQAEPLSRAVNTAIDELRRRFPSEECANDMVAAISHLAAGARQATKQERLTAVSAATADFTLAQARLQDMAGAALDQQQVEMLNVRAREAGFESVHCLKLYGGDSHLAGWQLHLR